MKFKNKGRKIYKTKEKNYYGKSPVGKAFSVGLTVLLIGGIFFIGFSVAGPLINYAKQKGDTVSTTAPAFEEELITDANGEEITQEDTTAVTPFNLERFKAYTLSTMDIVDKDTLKKALKRVPADGKIEYIEVPLKEAGGDIYYATNNYYSTSSGIVQGAMKPKDIANAIVDAGYKPVAHISTFYDNVVPMYFQNMSYLTYADGMMWIDNSTEAGGKPWLNPFSEDAVNYITDIVDEVSSAGFVRVVCSDFVFPDFRQSDIDYLGDKFISNDRYMALTSAANMMYEKAMSNGSKMILEVDATDILKGKKDVLQPMLLKVNTVILNIDFDALAYGVFTPDTVYEFNGTPSENVRKMLDLVGDDLEDFNVAVRVSGSTAGIQELLDAKDEIVGCGYDSYVIG
ncbi:putative glycoside hydrolase [uncultured Ruminococcus sp.]|uniref:putative glycoside hydrolase n=1 Tax=uncultured Ruminococcus sp. TaxID=165186 RepID=UPI0025D8E23E|nr:putative glycoside hydrolase [uncultured Ruminococcus sp.]